MGKYFINALLIHDFRDNPRGGAGMLLSCLARFFFSLSRSLWQSIRGCDVKYEAFEQHTGSNARPFEREAFMFCLYGTPDTLPVYSSTTQPRMTRWLISAPILT